MNDNKPIKAYKGFNKDLTCRGFQYKVGKEYKHKGTVSVCNSGFHACESPMEVLSFYPPCDDNGTPRRYCEVEQSGTLDRSEYGKVCSSRLRVIAEIGLDGLIKAGVKFILDKVNWKDDKESNTGYRSAATNTGNCSVATNTGDRSVATNTGGCSAATNTGNCSAATNTGYRSAATNTGDRSAATNTGDCSAATNTGDCSAATNTGDCSAAAVEGKDSIAIVTGRDSKAKGSLGCWIVLTERDSDWHILNVKAAVVDGVRIKPDTWYQLVDGEFKDCN
ncbi:MAG: hypothetical protein U0M50_06330 [Paramuribaculum sp.]